MSIISSLNSSSLLPTVASNTISKSQLGSFEMNSKEFGPAAASVIGVAQAVGDAGETLATFSAESLEKLGEAATAVINGISDGVEQVANTVTDGASQLASTVSQKAELAASTVTQTATQLANSVKQTASDIVDGVQDAASETLDTLSEFGSNVASYGTLGVAAAEHLISELV